MWSLVATVVGNATLAIASFVFGLMALAVGRIPPRGEYAAPVARGWARCVLWSSGVRLERHFEERPESGCRVVFMANHSGVVERVA